MAQRSEGIDLQTLALTAVASATAAYVTSKVWAPGTLASAAMTPVFVALIKEALRKPTEVVTSAVPVRGRVRVRSTQTVPDDLPELFDAGAPPPLPPPEPGAAAGAVRVYSTRGRRLRWRLAVMTGLLGFAACVVLYTVPELIAGGSAAGGGNRTTLFGGGSRGRTTQRTTQSTTTSPSQTVTTPAQTVTETTPAPASTSTTPTTTTPAPPAAGTPTTTTPAAPAPETPTVQTTP